MYKDSLKVVRWKRESKKKYLNGVELERLKESMWKQTINLTCNHIVSQKFTIYTVVDLYSLILEVKKKDHHF